MRFALARLVLVGMVALSLPSCEEHPGPPVVAPEPPPPPVRQPRPVAASWSFRAGDVCTATAAGGQIALDVNVTRDTMELVARMGDPAQPANRSIPIEFTGPSGAWRVTGRQTTSGRVNASQPLTDDQAGRILVLLGGGTVTIGNRDAELPQLRVPNAGPPGRDWFECVRRQLFP